jgi:hypothetical protein
LRGVIQGLSSFFDLVISPSYPFFLYLVKEAFHIDLVLFHSNLLINISVIFAEVSTLLFLWLIFFAANTRCWIHDAPEHAWHDSCRGLGVYFSEG